MTNRRPPPGFENFRPGSEQAPQPGQPNGGHPHAAHPGAAHPPRSARPGPPPGGRRPGPRRRPKRKSKSGIGTVILFLAVGIVALIGAGLAFIVVAPPTDFIRDQLVAQVKSNTGRNLKIAGPTGLSFYPALGFSMSGVSLSSPPEMGGAPLVRMKKMTVQVKLLPLLSRKVSVDQFILQSPQFDLRVDKNGRKNWEFALMGAKARAVRFAQAPSTGATLSDAGIRLAQAPASQGGNQGGSMDLAALEQIELGDVRIINGSLRYRDNKAAANEQVDKINVKVELTSIASPFTASGDLVYKGDKIDFKASLRNLKRILGKKPATLNATVSTPRLAGSYNGSIDAAGVLKLDGKINAQTKSVRSLVKWLGTDLPPARGFRAFTLNGKLKANGPVYSLSGIDMTLDGAKGTGNVTVSTAGARPKIEGNLRLSELDLNEYMANGETAGGGKKKKARARPKGNSKNAANGNQPSSIEDLIGTTGGPRVKGYTKRAGWSNDPIDVTALGAVDANLKLALGKLLYEKIKVGRSNMTVVLNDRALTAKLNQMQLYEGTGRGVVTLNARQAKPIVGVNFNLSGVSAQPLLTDAVEMDWLAGKGRLLLAVKSIGASEREIIQGLNGTSSLAFTDGAIVGVNVPKVIRGVQQGRFNDLQGAPNEKTDFSKLTASFKIVKGIATNTDLSMVSPLLRVTGNGKVMLPGRRVDYTVKPKIVASLRGQGGAGNAKGLEIPVRVHGPFEKLSYTPDLKGMFSNPGQAADTVRQLGKKFGGEKAGKALDGLLGGGGDKGGAAKKLLDGFLGGR
ncbi:MAG: AsmA family protein [Alphaproteobacteria bacterium]|nr:AsmA family protein [Alphaproteobacteria bacterium]